MQHASHNRLRRAVVFAALAALLGVVSLTLSQCTMVGDNLTGVGLTSTAPTTCVKQCNNLYDLLFKLEQKKTRCRDRRLPVTRRQSGEGRLSGGGRRSAPAGKG